MASQCFRSQLPLSGKPSPTPQCILRCRGANRTRLACLAFVDNGSGHAGTNGNGAGLPLSMFTPYRQLPPEGEMVPAADIACDPTLQKCKTPIYTYESKCSSCAGTGFVKSHANGRRASLCTCLMCHGIGYVRRTTARFAPDNGPSSGVFTLARPEQETGAKDKAGRKGKGKAGTSH